MMMRKADQLQAIRNHLQIVMSLALPSLVREMSHVVYKKKCEIQWNADVNEIDSCCYLQSQTDKCKN